MENEELYGTFKAHAQGGEPIDPPPLPEDPGVTPSRAWLDQHLARNLQYLGYEVPNDPRRLQQIAIQALDDLRAHGPCEALLRRIGRRLDGGLALLKRLYDMMETDDG